MSHMVLLINLLAQLLLSYSEVFKEVLLHKKSRQYVRHWVKISVTGRHFCPGEVRYV